MGEGTPAWNYLIPKYYGSPWQNKYNRTNYSADLDHPTVGIYCCRDEPMPWLCGSFSVSSAVWEKKQEVFWGWRRDYLTGDGHMITLGRGQMAAGGSPEQSIVDDRPWVREDAHDRLTAAIRDHGILSSQATAVHDELRHADATLRLRIPVRCGICGLARTFRSDTVQDIVTRLWQVGIREIDLLTFARRVDRRRK